VTPEDRDEAISMLIIFGIVLAVWATLIVMIAMIAVQVLR
jgi:hypothetical protein